MASRSATRRSVARMLDANPAAIRTTVIRPVVPDAGSARRRNDLHLDARHRRRARTRSRASSATRTSCARPHGAHARRHAAGRRRASWTTRTFVRQLLAGASRDRGRRSRRRTRRKIADAARDNTTTAVRLMLEAGWPADARGQHQATPLHWAGFHGNAEMARMLLAHAAPLDVRDRRPRRHAAATGPSTVPSTAGVVRPATIPPPPRCCSPPARSRRHSTR